MSTGTTAPTWEIVARPKGANTDGKNKGGIVVYLRSHTAGEQEVSRVAFERKEGFYKDVPFKEQLDKVITTAEEAIEALNKLFENKGKLL